MITQQLMKEKSNYLKYVLHAVILIGLIRATMKYVNSAEVWQALQNFHYMYLPVILALSLFWLLLKAARFTALITPFAPGLAKVVVYEAYVAGQAATLVPGGIAVRAGLLKQLGIPIGESSVAVIVHSGWDQAIFLISALVTALWFPEVRSPIIIILAVLGGVVLLFLVPAARLWLTNLAEKIISRFNYEAQFQLFLAAIPQVFTRRIAGICFLLTLVSLIGDIGILYITLRGFDLSVSYPTLFVAVTLPTLLGRIVPTPGGVGVTEMSMVGLLSSLAQLDINTTVSAMAIFRIVTVIFPAVVGALVYFLFWRGEEKVNGRASLSQSSTESSRAGSSD